MKRYSRISTNLTRQAAREMTAAGQAKASRGELDAAAVLLNRSWTILPTANCAYQRGKICEMRGDQAAMQKYYLLSREMGDMRGSWRLGACFIYLPFVPGTTLDPLALLEEAASDNITPALDILIDALAPGRSRENYPRRIYWMRFRVEKSQLSRHIDQMMGAIIDRRDFIGYCSMFELSAPAIEDYLECHLPRGNEQYCAICMLCDEKPARVVKVLCSHELCVACIAKMVLLKRTDCPFCRAPLIKFSVGIIM